MSDDSKKAEQDLRSQTADAFHIDRPKEAESSKFDRFEISPAQSKTIDDATIQLEENLKSRFR